VTVRLSEAEPMTGGLLLELLAVEGGAVPQGPKQRGKAPTRRKAIKAGKKSDKIRRKARRTRG
jgi:ribonuclease R